VSKRLKTSRISSISSSLSPGRSYDDYVYHYACDYVDMLRLREYDSDYGILCSPEPSVSKRLKASRISSISSSLSPGRSYDLALRLAGLRRCMNRHHHHHHHKQRHHHHPQCIIIIIVRQRGDVVLMTMSMMSDRSLNHPHCGARLSPRDCPTSIADDVPSNHH
jgi:hypothetical protein